MTPNNPHLPARTALEAWALWLWHWTRPTREVPADRTGNRTDSNSLSVKRDQEKHDARTAGP